MWQDHQECGRTTRNVVGPPGMWQEHQISRAGDPVVYCPEKLIAILGRETRAQRRFKTKGLAISKSVNNIKVVNRWIHQGVKEPGS